MSTNAPLAVDVEVALRDSLGSALALGDDSFAVDGIAPRFVVTPDSVDQLAAALAAANEAGAAVIAWGGGRHMALGNAPACYDVALRTAKLNRVIEHEPADLTVTVEAGVTVGSLQALLGEHGQFLPIDAPGEATAGGVLAVGVSGPSRHAYGLPRDWLLGCRFVQADGTIVKAGGRVVKNVAGYDLPKLVVGSLGTLGVLVEATFKVAPLPPAQETLLFVCASLRAAAESVFAADDRGLALRAVEIANGRAAAALPDAPALDDGQTLTAFWLVGSPAAVERTAREINSVMSGSAPVRLEGEDSARWWPAQAEAIDDAVMLRASLPPTAVAGFLERCDGPAVAYPTTGLVLASLEARAAERGDFDALRRAARDAGGSLIVTRAPADLKRRVDVWGETEALSLMQRLKEEFDPKCTLSPGRFIGGL